MTTGLDNWTLAAPEIFLAVAAMALLLIGAFRGTKGADLVSWLSVASLAIAIFLVLRLEHGTAFHDLFLVDAFTKAMKVLSLLGAGIAVVMSRGYFLRAGVWRAEFPVLAVLATLGMLVMISANDLMTLYLGLEMQSLALYVMAAFQRDSERSTEAGLKYFVLSSVASGMLLYGISLVYGFAGTTSFPSLARGFLAGEVSTGAVVGLVFVLAGLVFKVSAVPFHMWTPDVYEGAPTPVTALFSVAPKIAALSLIVSVVMGPFRPLLLQWQQIMIAVAVLSTVWGAIAALRQENIKRLMAYSSIGHMGYVLLGLAAGTEEGVRSVVVYMIIYLATNVGTFAVILSMRRKGEMVERISDLAGLSQRQPMMAAALLLFMFSMAGIPPMAGFFAKLNVFIAAVNASLYIPAAIAVLASVVGAYYYLRIVKVMYFDAPAPAFDRPVERDMAVVMLAAALFVFPVFPVFQTPFLNGAQTAAKTFFSGK
ncbi:NADH-quinone oxidoreductase subunit NuoN [Vineibacter terrae]|uniref:NADH-quinone oxidoreductase subunit NuoN n=1 Tax=Vineibacter terrae TaxID=2586908 RepID=UPI002E306A0A|nr:NADH-quinone oxidoreductase subunit NuoN [Vineibacter terrae]HEX2892215.1 NADH-quinone oxidoreductase subunit NuoN [Vineibacter terrae]